MRSWIARATYMAVKVLPVPGGPWSRMPRFKCRPAATSFSESSENRTVWRSIRSSSPCGRMIVLSGNARQPVKLDLHGADLGFASERTSTAIDVPLPHRGSKAGQKLLRQIAARRHHLDADLGNRMKLLRRPRHQNGERHAAAVEEEQAALDARKDTVLVQNDVCVFDGSFSRSPPHQAGL